LHVDADLPAHRALLKTLLWLAVALGAIVYCNHYRENAPGVTLYVEAARCLLDGLRLQGCNPTYTYPPIFALVTIPLVPLPLVLQNLAWYLLTLGALAGCFMLSGRLAQRLVPDDWSGRELAWLYGIGFLLTLKFALAVIGNQSYDALMVLLVLAGLAGLAEDRPGWSPVWAGVSFGCAAALKATPLLFLPYLVFKRHYRTAAVMATVLVVVSILPDLIFSVGRKSGDGGYLLAWLHQIAQPALTEQMNGNPHTFWFATSPNNNSLRGLIGIFVDDYDPTSSFKKILYPVDAVYAVIVALLIWRTRESRPALAIDGALLLISMLALSPMSSQSHYIALVLPIFAMVAVWQKGDAAMRKVAGVFIIANVVLTNATSKDLAGTVITQWAKEHRLLIGDALLFLVFFAILVFRAQLSGAKSGTPSAIGQPAA
jgi:hypothetical protein